MRRLINGLRNRLGGVLNMINPPGPEVFDGVGDYMRVILVGLRWGYGSRLNRDGFEYRRFVPALARLCRRVDFVPCEGGRRIVSAIRDLCADTGPAVVLSIFQSRRQIPDDYFSLSGAGCHLVNWYTDDDMFFESFSRHVAQHFDLNVTTYEPLVERYQSLGAAAVASQWAGLPGLGFRDRRRYGACFVGRMYGCRRDLMKALQRRFGSRVFLHDTRLSVMDEQAMIDVYQDSWLAIDEPLSYDGRTLQIKARLFENAAMGALVVTRPNPRIERYYEPGKEILYWNDVSDLIEIIDDCLRSPEKYRHIARNAYERTLREHLYEHRFRDILRHCAAGSRTA
jgi:hypothetical protein